MNSIVINPVCPKMLKEMTESRKIQFSKTKCSENRNKTLREILFFSTEFLEIEKAVITNQ